MQSNILTAETGSIHPDGTVSLLRIGINTLMGKAAPFVFNGVVFVRIESDIGEGGKHTFDLRLVDLDGRPAGASVSGAFEVPDAKYHVHNILVPTNLSFPKPGEYQFVLRIDQQVAARFHLTASLSPDEPK